MSGVKLEISWSPIHDNRFITVGNDIILYQIEESNSVTQKSSCKSISDTEHASVLFVNADFSYVKCVAWHPKCTSDHILAVGLSSGKVVIANLEQNSQDSQRLNGREFAPKQPRQCNGIAWNPFESNLLACGLEKHRSECSLLIWDINRPQQSYTSKLTNVVRNQQSPYHTITHSSGISTSDVVNSLARSQTMPQAYNVHSSEASAMNRPLIEYGSSEAVHSLEWFHDKPKTLVIGNNNKYLKIFDLRDDPLKHHTSTLTKAVFGVCTDPFYEHRLASYVDNLVYIWDIRNFEKPVVTLQESKPVSILSWCPTRRSLLSSLGKDSSIVNLYDIQSMNDAQDESEPAIVNRSIKPQNESKILSFSWHPSQENKMLAISSMGTINKNTVAERICLSWSPSNNFVWSNGADLQNINADHIPNLNDISTVIRRRAVEGYGLKDWQYSDMTDDPKLAGFWRWLDDVKNSSDDHKYRIVNACTKLPSWFIGVHSLICFDGNISTNRTPAQIKSELVSIQKLAIDGPMLGHSTKLFKSPNRDKAIQLCGWGDNYDYISFSQFLDTLVSDGQFERAAALSVFNLRLRDAIQILDKQSSIHKSGLNLHIVAMALSGYTEEKRTLWREMCDSLRKKFDNPYLSAMFAFLTAADYNEILNETGITVKDRVAFACLFLSDTELVGYLDQLNSTLIEAGDLDGILLTGFTQNGIDLLQNYIDQTSDVQTVSLILLQILGVDQVKDPRPMQWIDSYREFLDQWSLWHQRALFDVQFYKQDIGIRPPQQVSVSCNFCGKSISAYVHAMTQARARPVASAHGPSANRNKVSCCPGCRKPLPRCALCLINMGTPSGSFKPKKVNAEEVDKEQKRNRFGNWFTWCQTCRHGGHTDHMMEWFKSHKECPVTTCTCKCMCLDQANKMNQVQQEA